MACRLLPMYNLAKAVGPYRPNSPDDVKLVESLLKAAKEVGDPFAQGLPQLTPSGIFTPVLAKAIVDYQKGFQGTNVRIVADGVVDPLPSRSGFEGDWDIKYGNGASSTLMVLCYRLFKKNRDLYMKIGEDLNLPWKPDPFVI